jgi:hypothetical protein
MDLTKFFEALRWRWTDVGQRLAAAVVEACHAQVWDRVGQGACAMGLDEARGYVRARSVPLLAREAARILRENGLGAGRAADLTIRAADLLVNTILADILRRDLPLSARRKAA